ncbi:MAG TPA: hypothetical protein VI685_03420 [Candidatus Angelobacter sp.]
MERPKDRSRSIADNVVARHVVVAKTIETVNVNPPAEAPRLVVLVVLFWEYAVPGTAVAALLWSRLPHNVLAVLAGILTTVAYRWLVSIDEQPVLGIMVVFRTLLWGIPLGAIGVGITGAADGDLIWKIFVGVAGFVAGTIAAVGTHKALDSRLRETTSNRPVRANAGDVQRQDLSW